MTDGPQKRDEEFGAELRRRQSPKLAREQRHREFWAGIAGLVMGLVILAVGINSMRTGQWVHYGRVGDSVELPGWAVVVLALAILSGSGWVLLRMARRKRFGALE